MAEGEPEAAEHGEAVGVLVLGLGPLLPLVGREAAQDVHREGGEDEHPEGVHVHVRREGVQESEQGGGGRPGPGGKIFE